LTRLRIVMTFGLSNQIYQIASRPDATAETAEVSTYRPYIRDPEANPELVRLHEGAIVEISPESICFKQPLELFVCGKRQRTRKRETPLAEPITFISAAFLTLIKPSWLACIGQPHIAVARLIAAETRDPHGALLATTTKARLFIDQTYPVGTTFACTVRADRTAAIGQWRADPAQLRTSRNYEDIEAPEDIEVLEAEGALSEELGADDIVVKFAAEEVGSITDLLASDNEEQERLDATIGQSNAGDAAYQPSTATDREVNFPGRIVRAPDDIAIGKIYDAVVVGYDFTERSAPVVLLDLPTSPAPFDQFYQGFTPKDGKNSPQPGRKYPQEGDVVEVEVETIEQYVNVGTATGAQIDTHGLQVTVTAADNTVLQRTLDEIRAAVSYCRLTIQVTASMASRAIGAGGETVKMIRAQSGAQRIDLEKDAGNRFTGRIMIEAPSRSAADRARQLIENHTGPATILSVDEGTLPPISEVRPDVAPPRRQQTQRSDMPTSAGQRSSRPLVSPPSLPPAPKSEATKIAPPRPISYSQELRFTIFQLAALTRKQGGFFTTLFGGGKSALQRIQELTGTKIEVNATTGGVRIVGQTEQAVQQATQLIREAIG
jgi:hypothetical protein